ncbi:sulfurtransferase TusA family protein [Psychromonas sp. MME2]|uniref:sulfurtransferase TusA family protein n=1 Tax=unclassified Psychromonas TaxID=2614957 RepID=UPI00339C8302
MKIIDLQSMRCPMSLIIVKQFLLAQKKVISITESHSACLLFDNYRSLQDIKDYFDKKGYQYVINEHENIIKLVIHFS